MDPDSDIMKKLRHKSHDSDGSNAQDTKEMEVSNLSFIPKKHPGEVLV